MLCERCDQLEMLMRIVGPDFKAAVGVRGDAVAWSSPCVFFIVGWSVDRLRRHARKTGWIVEPLW